MAKQKKPIEEKRFVPSKLKFFLTMVLSETVYGRYDIEIKYDNVNRNKVCNLQDIEA